MPGTPPRLSHSDDDSISPRPTRARVNSREYVHSYDGAYGSGNDDMVGVIVARDAGGWWVGQQWSMFTAYIMVLVGIGVVVGMLVSSLFPKEGRMACLTFTITNIIHFFVTLIYLHWMKGATREDQGDLEHMTLWEQIEATPDAGRLRFALRMVPTGLCYLACIEAGWKDDLAVCTVNVIVWYLTLLGKMPFMNGVRILNINAHPVINRE